MALLLLFDKALLVPVAHTNHPGMMAVTAVDKCNLDRLPSL